MNRSENSKYLKENEESNGKEYSNDNKKENGISENAWKDDSRQNFH